MKIVHPLLNSRIEIKSDKINVLIIESPMFLCNFLLDVKKQINNYDGDAVLSINDVPVSFHKYVELVSDPLSLDMNKRTVMKRVLSAIEKYGLDEENYERTQNLVADIEKYIDDLLYGFDTNIICNDISLGQILKALDLSIQEEYDTLQEKLYSYIEIIREFEGDKLFIFVNLSSYIGKEGLQDFANTALSHSFNVLLIDSQDFQNLDNENRLIIDSDLCEF